MSSSTSAGRPIVREAPTVGEHRRGSRLRTTAAGTWFPAVSPDGEPAGLLLVHPGVDTKVLLPTIERLAELVLPGVLTPRPTLVEQAGRNWLVTDAPPVPTLADLLVTEGPHRAPGNAGALLSDVAATLLATHRSGLAHGAVDTRSVLIGQDGAALLTDWGTSGSASAAADVRAWAKLAATLAEQWCAEDVESAAALARAVQAATGPTGLAGGFDQLRPLAYTAQRATLAAAAKDKLAALSGGGQARPPRSARRAARAAASPEVAAPDGLPAGATPASEAAAAEAATAGPTAPATASAPAPFVAPPTYTEPPVYAEPAARAEPPAHAEPPTYSEPAAYPEPPAYSEPATCTEPPRVTPPATGTPTGHRPPPATPESRPSAAPEPAWSTAGPTADAPDAPWASPGAEPAPPRRGRSDASPSSGDTAPRWQVTLLAVVVVITLAVGLADLVLMLTRSTGDGSSSSSGLEVQSVSAWAQRDGATCTLFGLITTNGGSGTVTYGWTGDAAAGTAMTVEAHDGHPQIEVTQPWAPGADSTSDPVITLQVLRPGMRQASVQPASACGR